LPFVSGRVPFGDMIGALLEVAVILALVIANGFLAGAEIAIVSARKARLQHRARQGDGRARKALKLANSPNRFLSTVQIGITLIGCQYRHRRGTGAS
jgi:putative hemolysin